MNTPNKEEEKKAVLKGERRRIIEQLREEVRAGVKADWLRSEIEKLFKSKKEVKICSQEPHHPRCLSCESLYSSCDWAGQYNAYNQAIDDIITRYKEELLELEKVV